MHQSVKAQRYYKVQKKNDKIFTSNSKCLEILSPEVFLNSEYVPICKSKKSEFHSSCNKRAINSETGNIYNKNSPTAIKSSSSFPNFTTKIEQNYSAVSLNNTPNATVKYLPSNNYLQNIPNKEAINKAVLETKTLSYKEFEKISQPQQNNDNKKEEKLGENVDYTNSCLKETREKTPMCLVNDLARFNKISFQYRLTGEHGPAHCKRFTVTLKLGDEEYTAEGFKIKKAQHLAAKEAIEKTKYKHPIPKTNRRNDSEEKKINITPTVELNALAMKLGQQTYYILDPKQTFSLENNTNGEKSELISKYNVNQNKQSYDKSKTPQSKFQQSIRMSKFNPINTLESSKNCLCKITLIVGNQKFFGVGKSIQQAKHDAATNALQVLKNQMSNNKKETHVENLNQNEHKSPISLVFEIGIKRNLPVDFKVLNEEGPAHMRTFTTACIVGNILTEGEGTGKKLSKKNAAQKMLAELEKLPPLNSDTSPIKHAKIKTSSTNSIHNCKKNKKKYIAKTDSINPVSKVLEWHQNNSDKEPIFKIINEDEKENTKRRQFVMEISSNKMIARGIGNSKKLAKRDAAQNFLDAVNKNNEIYSNKSGTVSSIHLECSSNEKCGTAGQEKSIPSSINTKAVPNVKEANVEQKSAGCNEKSFDLVGTNKSYKSLKLKSTICKSSGLHMKDQLLYLANLLGFEVNFSDYPKGNHNEFLTIVMLSTNPPQISHGVGINSKESQEDASNNALKILSKMGLNNVRKS